MEISARQKARHRQDQDSNGMTATDPNWKGTCKGQICFNFWTKPSTTIMIGIYPLIETSKKKGKLARQRLNRIRRMVQEESKSPAEIP